MRYVEGLILRNTAHGLGARARPSARGRHQLLPSAGHDPHDPAVLHRPRRPQPPRPLRRAPAAALAPASTSRPPATARVTARDRPPRPARGPRCRSTCDAGAHLVHGDFHIDNAVFDTDLNVIAVFDWELATLGHPIADLAWSLLFWAELGDESTYLAEAVTSAPGFARRDRRAVPARPPSTSDVAAVLRGLHQLEDGVPAVGFPVPLPTRRSRRHVGAPAPITARCADACSVLFDAAAAVSTAGRRPRRVVGRAYSGRRLACPGVTRRICRHLLADHPGGGAFFSHRCALHHRTHHPRRGAAPCWCLGRVSSTCRRRACPSAPPGRGSSSLRGR